MEQKKRSLIGTVVSDKMQRTVVVEVERTKKHPRYLKLYKVTARYKCHDEENKAKTGNRVVIEETRPISKDKRWKVVEILKAPSKGTTE